NDISQFVVAFIFTLKDGTDMHGVKLGKINWTGYGINIATTNEGGDSFAPGFRIFRYNDMQGGSTNLPERKLENNITGWNHFDIIRDLNNKITVIFNGETMLSVTDSTWGESELVEVANFDGNVTIDNLRVIDYQGHVAAECDDTTILGWLLPIILLPIYMKKRNR
ncbi:MAG: hypothetical protein ACW99A_23735, partial [Candidatus Kariarchaeaceae archaeon]